MASREIHNDDSENGPGGSVAPDMNEQPPEPHRETGEWSPRHRVLDTAERDRMLKRAREISFPVGMRGYDRAAVDRYVETVNRTIAELEMSSSPESAVRHALDELSDETRDILQHAHQMADDITARSRARADDRLQEAGREAERVINATQQAAGETREAALQEAEQIRNSTQREITELRDTAIHEITELRTTAASESERLVANAEREADRLLGNARREAGDLLGAAESRARELSRSAETIWRERRRLVDDIRAVGEQLTAIGELESKRFTHIGEALMLDDGDGHVDGDAGPTATPQAPSNQGASA